MIVYSNHAGMTMLYVNVDASGANKWARFSRYDTTGRLLWAAEPSAVSGYDEAYDDLLNYNSGTGQYQYLRANDGLIRVTDYFATGAGVGRVSAEKLRRGQSGSDVPVRSYTYTSNTAGGATVVLPASEVREN